MSWIAFELLLLALGWLGVAFFRGYMVPKEMTIGATNGAGVVISVLFLGLLIPLIFYKIVPFSSLVFLLPIIGIGIAGFLEDKQKISTRTRWIFQVVALYISYYTIQFEPNFPILARFIPQWLMSPVIILGLLALNFTFEQMDKADGFIATHSLFILGFASFIFYTFGTYSLAILLFGLLALIGGVSAWNWPMAKIKMGKSGASFLGSLIGLLILYGHRWSAVPLEAGLILLMPFLIDMSLTTLRRGVAHVLSLKDKSIIEQPNYYAYERLLQAGCSPVKLLIGLIILDSILVLSALWVYKDPSVSIIFSFLTMALVFIIYILIESAKPMYRSWYTGKVLTAE